MYLKYKESKNAIKIVERESKHIEPHLHSALEIVYVTKGELELGMGTELFHMEKGDIGFVFPDVIHHYQVLCSGASKACYIQIQPSMISVFYDKLQKYAPKYPVVKKDKLDSELNNVIAAITHSDIADETIIEAYTQIILAKCMPELSLIDKQDVGSTDLIYQVVAYVSANFREEMILDKMAFDIGVSKYVLSRVFSKTFHRNFNQYVNDARLNYAVHCLENTNDSITDICMDSGFESQRTFNRVFKERYHLSPSEYRKKLQNK